MGKLTRFARRAAKPLAMFGVVTAVSLSLIVTTPSNAQALVKPKVAEEFIMGATKVIAPAAQAALVVGSFTPVGAGVRVLQLALLAYETQDIWLPFVKGLFGQSKDDAPAAGGANVLPGLVYQVPAIATPNYRLQVMIDYTGGPLVETVTVMARFTCKRTNGSTYAKDGFSSPQIGTSAPYSRQATATMYCDAAEDVAVGWIVGPPGGAPELIRGTSGPTSYKGPEGVKRGGTMSDGAGSFDPNGADVKYRVTSECIDASGVISSVTVETTGDMGAAVKAPSCAAAGKGHGTGKLDIVGLAPGTTVEQPLWSSPRAPSDPATPLCDAARPTGGCEMSIELDGKPCTSDNVECQNWAELQKSDPNNTRLKCRFGPYTLPMASCVMLEGAYMPGGSPSTNENTDGDPATRNWTDVNGNPIPAPDPTTTKTTVPGGAAPAAPPGSSPEQSQCFPSGWAQLNPVEWVMKPVSCALTAAFQPKKDIQTRVTTMQGQFANKVPVSWFSTGTQGVSGGGCPTNWALDVAGQHVSLICGTPVEGILLSFRPIMGAMLVIAALWPLVRSLFYAAIPIFKVTPS